MTQTRAAQAAVTPQHLRCQRQSPNDPFRQLEIDPPVFASVDLTPPLAKHDQDQDGVSHLATLLLFVLLSAFVTGGWVRFAGHLSVFHAIAATLDGNRLGMVEKPVE